jgi:serine/threonine protein kinase
MPDERISDKLIRKVIPIYVEDRRSIFKLLTDEKEDTGQMTFEATPCGSGTFCDAYTVKMTYRFGKEFLQGTNTKCVVKMNRDAELAYREIATLSSLQEVGLDKAKRIAPRFFGAYTIPSRSEVGRLYVIMVLEYFPLTLEKALKDRELSQMQKTKFLIEALRAYNHFIRCGLTHGDMKFDNIFVNNHEGRVVLGDFSNSSRSRTHSSEFTDMGGFNFREAFSTPDDITHPGDVDRALADCYAIGISLLQNYFVEPRVIWKMVKRDHRKYFESEMVFLSAASVLDYLEKNLTQFDMFPEMREIIRELLSATKETLPDYGVLADRLESAIVRDLYRGSAF